MVKWLIMGYIKALLATPGAGKRSYKHLQFENVGRWK